MTKKLILLFTALLLSFTVSKAQHLYHNASKFQLLGKADTSTETLYERLPAKLNGVSRQSVWDLGKNTAGLAIRFSSNSTSIAVKWSVLNEMAMNHMTPTGIKGLDLYSLEDGEWVYVNSARPTSAKEKTATIVSNMEKADREFMLHLPLYDGVTDLSIGVDSLAWIEVPKLSIPKVEKPIVAYGTSILQGGCATRPGMAHTNILRRKLNRDIINLGFSGNAQLDYEIAELIADVDASVYVLDFMPNVTADQVYEKLDNFYNIIRDKKKDTPIIFIENPLFPPMKYDLKMREGIENKNRALNEIVERLKKQDKNITLLSSKDIIGQDGEATVDGAHFTDLGFLRYADFLYPYLVRTLLDK